MRIAYLFISILFISACSGPKADLLLVEKSQNKMHVIDNGEVIKTFDISLGQNPIGHKQQRGDLRTPEGRYTINYKNYNSKFYRSLSISYPNEFDVAKARTRGVDPGDAIVIHGLPNGVSDHDINGPIVPQNWTEGCIALRNYEMDQLWPLVDVDTPIEIRP